MLFLIFNITSHRFNLRFGNRDCVVVILPMKFTAKKFLSIEPMCGFAFDQHCYFGNILFPAKRNKKMHMIGPAANSVQINVLSTAILAYVCKEFPSNIGREYLIAVSSGEDYMYPYTDE
jgi:hypothetical protein